MAAPEAFLRPGRVAIASVPDRGCLNPAILAAAADATAQQAALAPVREQDCFNWGYDPVLYTVPGGSYASTPTGTARILELRQMVQALHGAGLRVVMDVVYNHRLHQRPVARPERSRRPADRGAGGHAEPQCRLGRVGLADTPKDYVFVDKDGNTKTGEQIAYFDQPAGYTLDPQEVINCISAHDNQTLFDDNQYKIPTTATMPTGR